MSVGARVPIFATIITLIFATGAGDKPKPVRAKYDRIQCIRGEAIPNTERARVLTVVGERCRQVIVRTRPASRLP